MTRILAVAVELDFGPETWLGKLVRAGGVVVAAILLVRLTTLLTRRAERWVRPARDETPEERDRRVRTIAGLVRSALVLVIVIVAGLLVLDQADIDIAPLIAAAGIGGLAIGFGAQSLVRDVVSGFFVIAENQFRVGDVVGIAGTMGVVEQVSLRTTTVRDEAGRLHVVPNGQIVVATNYTKEWARVLVDVPVPSSRALASAEAVLQRVARDFADDPAWRERLLEPPAVLGVEALDDAAATLRVVCRVRPLAQWEVSRELRRRIRMALYEGGSDGRASHA